MAEGIVTARGFSKARKPTINIDGNLYYAGGTDLAGLAVGDRISFTATSFADGKFWGIDKGWKLLQAAQKYPPPQQPAQGIAPPSVSPQPLKGITEGERLTISNWVAAAIQSGKVEGPADIKAWAEASLHAVRGAGNPDYVPF